MVVGTLLPEDNANDEDGQSDSDHCGWRGERPVGVGWLDLIEFFEKLAGIELLELEVAPVVFSDLWISFVAGTLGRNFYACRCPGTSWASIRR